MKELERTSSSHFVIPGQKTPIFRYFPLSSRPANYSTLKISIVSNIIYPQERNMRTNGYRLSMYEARVLGSL